MRSGQLGGRPVGVGREGRRRLPGVAARTLEAGAPQLLRERAVAGDASERFCDRLDVGRVDEDADALCELLRRRASRRDHGRALRHRLDDGEAEALEQARHAQDRRGRVERLEIRARQPAEHADAVAGARGEIREMRFEILVPAARPDEHELDVRVVEPGEGADQAGEVLARLDRARPEDEPLRQRIRGPHARDVSGRGDLSNFDFTSGSKTTHFVFSGGKVDTNDVIFLPPR